MYTLLFVWPVSNLPQYRYIQVTATKQMLLHGRVSLERGQIWAYNQSMKLSQAHILNECQYLHPFETYPFCSSIYFVVLTRLTLSNCTISYKLTSGDLYGCFPPLEILAKYQIFRISEWKFIELC